MELTEGEKIVIQLTFLRDEFKKQLGQLQEKNEDLEKRIKTFVAHIDDIEKAPDKVQALVSKNLDKIVQGEAHCLVEKADQNVVSTIKTLGDAANETTRAIRNAQNQLFNQSIGLQLAFGAGSIICAVFIFFILHLFVFNKNIETIALTSDVHQRLEWLCSGGV